MTPQPLAITLTSSLTICQTIEGLLQNSFGPNALHTMLTSSTGNVVITGDGFTLLTSLHLSHPIARWIVGQVKGHHTATGDNAKSYILIVTEILRQLQGAISCRDADATVSFQRQEMIRIGRALEIVQSEVFPRMVLPTLLEDCLQLSLVESNRKDVVCVCEKIVQTALGGRFSRHSVDHVVGLTVDLVCSSCTDISYLGDVIEQLISDYDVLCWEVPHQPVCKSRLIDGVVLARNFVIRADDLESQTVVPFVILSCSLDKWIPDSPSTLIPGSSEELVKTFMYGTSKIRQLTDHLERRGLKLILSSELLSDVSLSFCRAAGISAVHMIPEEELQRLSRLTNTDIVYEPSDIMMPAFKTGSAEFCRSITVGNKIGVHLGLGDRVPVKQLVLCAPTQGICRQWFMAVFNTLKILRMWLDNTWQAGLRIEDRAARASCGILSSGHAMTGSEWEARECPSLNRCSPVVIEKDCVSEQNKLHSADCRCEANEMTSVESKKAFSVPGGGYTELRLHKLFQSLASCDSTGGFLNGRDPFLDITNQILGQAALCIPRTLHRNSFVAKSQTSSFVDIISRLKDAPVPPVGINGKTGALCNPSEYGILEPLSGRLKLWSDAIRTVQDLLRMDMIVGVKTLPCSNSTTSASSTCNNSASCDSSEDE